MHAERRGARRLKVTHGRMWLDHPLPHWAEILDLSPGGARIASPHLLDAGAHVRLTLVKTAERPSSRPAVVVYARGAMAGVRYLDRRGLRARIGGHGGQSAEVLRWEAAGATLAIEGALPSGTFDLELTLGSIPLARRPALVVRAAGQTVEVRFVELAP